MPASALEPPSPERLRGRLQVRGISSRVGIGEIYQQTSTTAVGTAALTSRGRLAPNTFIKLVADVMPPGRRKPPGLVSLSEIPSQDPRRGPSGRHDIACAPANGRDRHAEDFIHSARTSRSSPKSVRLFREAGRLGHTTRTSPAHSALTWTNEPTAGLIAG